MRILGLFVLGLSVLAWTADPAVPDSLKVVEKKRSTLTSVVAWPFEKVIQPTFNLVLYPLKPPLTYIMKNDVIDRGIGLITLGDHQQVMLYPTFNLKPGTGTSLGGTYRHRGLISSNGRDYWVNSYNHFINADWEYRTKYSWNKLFGTELATWASFRMKEDQDASFCMKEISKSAYNYADSSWEWKAGVSNPLAKNWTWQYSFGVERKLFAEPNIDVPLLNADDAPQVNPEIFDWRTRGFYQEFWQYPMEFQVTYNGKDTRFIPTNGQWARFSWSYVPVSKYVNPEEDQSYANSYDHDYYAFTAAYQTYFLIGKKQYSLTRAENKANQKYLKSLSLEKTMNLLNPDQLRETLLERKVIAVQLRMRQMWDADPGGAPFTGFSELGTNAPLRGYDKSLWDFNVYSISCEYRWPLLDLVDGVVFNEYGLFGRSWDNPQWENLRNSWGFGIRVRKPRMFLTRLQLGFHGMQGVNLIMTIQPEFL